jgi:hypothetical protein
MSCTAIAPSPDRGGASLARSWAHVTGGEDARDARVGQITAARVCPREDEAVLVARDDVGDPFGEGPCAEEEQQECERHALRSRVALQALIAKSA